MKNEDINWLTTDEAEKLNELLILKYTPKEQIGIKSFNELDSAINRPKQSAFGEDAYETIWLKATALFESLVKNHAFYNANKRTAFMCLYIFLRKNNIHLNMDAKFAENLTVNFAKKIYSFEEVAKILEDSCEIESKPNLSISDDIDYVD